MIFYRRTHRMIPTHPICPDVISRMIGGNGTAVAGAKFLDKTHAPMLVNA